MAAFRALLKRAIDLPSHFPAHAGRCGFQFYRRRRPLARPVRLQDPFSLKLACDLAAQIEDLSGILPLYRVAGHILAEVADPFVQRALAELRLNYDVADETRKLIYGRRRQKLPAMDKPKSGSAGADSGCPPFVCCDFQLLRRSPFC